MVRNNLLIFFFLVSFGLFAQEYSYTFRFFQNSPMKGDYFFSKTISSGDSFIDNKQGKLPVSSTVFHTPGNSIELNYMNTKSGSWSASIYRQEIRGMDNFKAASHLSFWIFNPSDLTTVKDLPTIQLMRKDSSLTKKQYISELPVAKWHQIMLSLKSFSNSSENPSDTYIAVIFSQQNTINQQHILFIDDVECVSWSPLVKPVVTTENLKAKGYSKHIDLSWEAITDSSINLVEIYRSSDGVEFRAIGIQQPYINRFTDFTGETGKTYFYKTTCLSQHYDEGPFSSIVKSATIEMNDDELLTMVQEASFRYYWEAAEPVSGLALENIHGRHNMIATGASGFGIMALIAGTERQFITRDQAVERFIKIVKFLENAESFHGVYPHFLDGTSGKTVPFFGQRDNGADLVETSFLLQGLLTAKQYFSGENENEALIREKITTIWEKVEWDWFRKTPESKFLYWHWSPDKEWIINHNLIGWNETMVTYLLAIASPTHSIPASMYYSGWANQDSTGYNYRANWGQTSDGATYTNGKSYYGVPLAVGVSNGGPLFFTHYSYMGYNPHLITDEYTNYFVNNQHIAIINYKYCVENPLKHKGYGYDGWGLTASDGPFDYSADEPVIWQDHGKLAPTGAISSFPYTPKESMDALKNYYNNYGSFLWGEYGFKDAFSLSHNWCSTIYMGLNQAPMAVMIENYRSGLIWKLFMQNEDIQNGLNKLENETNSRKK